jgi:hypothetical protein
MTFDKPIPVRRSSPSTASANPLCYRCTRFSEGVAEDNQLVAQNRGASSVIATFEDEPYRAPFSGNVIELCPVGALTSTQYRFEARPWEIQDVPTVCGLCPAGCNIRATTREGAVKRVQSEPPGVDGGGSATRAASRLHLRRGPRPRAAPAANQGPAARRPPRPTGRSDSAARGEDRDRAVIRDGEIARARRVCCGAGWATRRPRRVDLRPATRSMSRSTIGDASSS